MDIPQDAQNRHELLASAMSGELGALFHNVILEGRRVSEPIVTTSYLALYGGTEVIFVRTEQHSLTGEVAARRAQEHSLVPQEAPGPFVQTLMSSSLEDSISFEQ